MAAPGSGDASPGVEVESESPVLPSPQALVPDARQARRICRFRPSLRSRSNLLSSPKAERSPSRRRHPRPRPRRRPNQRPRRRLSRRLGARPKRRPMPRPKPRPRWPMFPPRRPAPRWQRPRPHLMRVIPRRTTTPKLRRRRKRMTPRALGDDRQSCARRHHGPPAFAAPGAGRCRIGCVRSA